MELRLIAALSLLAGAVSGSFLSPDYIDKFVVKMWHDYKGGYRKEYAGAGVEMSEDHQKMLVFQKSLMGAYEMQQANPETTFGFTMFTDYTEEEWKRFTHGGEYPPTPEFPTATVEYTGDGPKNGADRRRDMTVSHVKHQMGCPVSGAFAATGAIEGAYAAAGSVLRPLSEEWVMTCAAKGKCSCETPEGCSPGELLKAVMEAGGKVPLEEDYEFSKGESGCKLPDDVRYGAEVQEVLSLPNDPAFLKKWIVKHGAFAASVSNVQQWKTYQEGIVSSTCGGPAVAAVTIIGFDKENDREYFLAKNSWGSSWGHNGIIKLDMKSSCLIDPIAVRAKGLPVENRHDHIDITLPDEF
eukprot:TRINITY_DN6984_c0_g1_i1.p1 TRINITY_DN6984_c0_g1~~TRINITY_DN6984_c0_g1_i1.p1  ORF type:complete len:354 (+),score=73.06 TRINITY_DN6984_c0_g1_i1:83-1144(+)